MRAVVRFPVLDDLLLFGVPCRAVQMLRDRFTNFANDTEDTGRERVSGVNEIADELIAAGHSDAATIAEWKDSLNEAWADLKELIETRKQAGVFSFSFLFLFFSLPSFISRTRGVLCCPVPLILRSISRCRL